MTDPYVSLTTGMLLGMLMKMQQTGEGLYEAEIEPEYDDQGNYRSSLLVKVKGGLTMRIAVSEVHEFDEDP